MKQNEGDFLYARTGQFLNYDFLMQTHPTSIEQYSASHKIDHSFVEDKNSNTANTFQSSLSNLLWAWLMVSLLVLIIFNKLNNKVLGKNIKTQKIIKNFFNANLNLRHSANTLGLVLLFYNFYQMLVTFLYCNTIKTNKIIVDVDKIISSTHQLLNTDKHICWLSGKFYFLNQNVKN